MNNLVIWIEGLIALMAGICIFTVFLCVTIWLIKLTFSGDKHE